jgi:photosystem II stability/assembly factor-like uncharacterized protein
MMQDDGAAGVRRQRIGRVLLVAGLVALVGMLCSSAVQPIAAQATAAWESLGPAGQRIDRLYTPASGALLASGPDALIRSDDGGVTWRTINRPAGTKVTAVSPTDHQLLYAAGLGGIFRSEDGGDNWQQVSAHGDAWIVLEISPADPSVLYGVAIVGPPADYGTNRDLEFRVSHDAGSTWETVRTQHERILPGAQPCDYEVPLLLPGSASTAQVYDVEGCTGRGDDPIAGMSPDEGRTVQLFPDLQNPTWGANALVGGTDAKPDRWYVSLFNHGIPNGNSRKSRILRTDDAGASWTTVLDAAEWPTTAEPRKPIDFSRTLTYNPRRPDDVYVVFEHFEPDPTSSSKPSTSTGTVLRASHDAGATWTDLGSGDIPAPSRLAVGIDGRYLFAATENGVYRLALAP